MNKNNNFIDKVKGMQNLSTNQNSISGGSEYDKKMEKLTSKKSEEIILIDNRKPNNIIKTYEKEIKIDEIDVPNAIVNLLIGKDENFKSTDKLNFSDMPFISLNILFKSIALVKAHQFSASFRPKQLELFADEFKKEPNTKVRLTIDIKDISSFTGSDGVVRGRKGKVRNAIDFLRKNLYVWVVAKDSEGVLTDYTCSFLESPSFSRGKVTFDMSVFWYEKMVNLGKYNTMLLELPNLLGNTKHIIFSMYLERWELNKWSDNGWNYKKINEMFNLSYSSANQLAKGFLRELRHKLDKNSLRSFQYKVKGDEIFIYPYMMKNIVMNDSVKLETKTLEKLDNNYFSNYIVRRHQLNEIKKKTILSYITNSEGDKNTLKNAYEEFKKECRKAKVSVITYMGDEFILKYNQFIETEYKKSERYKSFPEGSPRL